MLALLAALALPTAAFAAPVDPPTVFGVPEAAPGCPDPLLDCAAPTDTTALPAIPASGWFKTDPVSATLGGADDPSGSGLARIEYSKDGAVPADGADAEVVDLTGEGDHSLAHRAVDTAGNASGWTLDSFGIDTVPPLNTTPAVDPSPRPSLTLYVTGSDATPGSGVENFKWTVDGGAENVGNPVSITTDGVHTLRTWVIDAAGNESLVHTDTVTIDAAPPSDTTVVPATWQRSSPVNVTLSGTDGATTMEYVLDGVAGTAAVGSTLPVGGDRAHTLKHRALDAVGNASPWTTSTLSIDATNPLNTSVAPTLWSAAAQHVSVSGTDATSGVQEVQWQIDGGAIQTHAGGSAVDVVVSGDGAHTVKTQVVDIAGNASGWRTDTVRVDTVTPTDQTSPTAGWNRSAPTVQVIGYDEHSGIATVEWNLDGGATTTVNAASTSVPVTGEGEHVLRTRVTDAVGHATGWKSSTIRVDTTMPSNTTIVPAATSWAGGRVAIELDGSDGGSGLAALEYMIDGAPAQSVADGTVVAITGDGSHTLETRALDVAGNASSWRSDTIAIDSVKPTDTTTVPAAVAYGVKATIAGTDVLSGVDRVEWRLDGQDGSGPTPSLVGLGRPGSHTLEHRVIDKAGNASAWKTDTVVVDIALNNDTTDPVDTTTPPAAWQTAASVSVPVTGTDATTAIDHVEWRADGGSPHSGPSGSTITLTGDGVHHFETRVIDLAGNDTDWVDRSVRIDTTSPSDTTAVPAWQATRTVTLAGSDATSGIDRMEWWIDGGSRVTGPAGSMITLPADGSFKLEHRAVDAAGNVSARRTDWVHIDTVKPVDATPAAPTGWQTTAWVVTPAGIDVGGSGIDRVEATLDGVAVTSFPITVNTDGEHTLATRAIDLAGNATDWQTQTVQIDLHAPADTTPAAPAGWRRTPWSTTPAADDGAGSGVTTIEWKLGDAGTVSTDPDVTISAEGATVLETRATDAVGHTSAWRKQTVRIDTGVPTVTLDCGSGAWATAATCAVGAAGGPSGIGSLTLTGAGASRSVAPGASVTIVAEGVATLTLAATDGAGNAAQATRTIRIDRTAPAPALACAATSAPTGYSCTTGATDAGSGVAAVRWRVDGGAWQAPAADGTFAVDHGTVELEATDHVGLTGAAPAAVLAERVVPVAPGAPEVRTRSVAVKRKGTHGSAGLLGAFELRSVRADGEPVSGTADVRPLSLGKGRFRVTIRLVSGQLTAERTRVMRFARGGYSPRMGVALSGVRSTMRAHLTVERRTGRRWREVAVANASLKP